LPVPSAMYSTLYPSCLAWTFCWFPCFMCDAGSTNLYLLL
jgi:hypothetical protein